MQTSAFSPGSTLRGIPVQTNQPEHIFQLVRKRNILGPSAALPKVQHICCSAIISFISVRLGWYNYAMLGICA